VSAQITGEESLSRIVEQLDGVIGVTDSKSEYFFEQLRSNLAVYGADAVAKALQYNAVETLYVISDDVSEGVIEVAEQQGGDVIYHEQITETDERLAMMADVAATLRYDIGE
jgi:stalled ribosome rescue protein Dom34